MECNQARVLMSLGGKDCQELAPSDQVVLEKHLEGCPECAAAAKGQQQLDGMLGKAMLAVPVPVALRSKVLAAVSRPPKPRYWPWVAAAAAVLLAVGLGGYLFFKPHATLDIEEFVYYLDQNTASGPETVENWFNDEGLTVAAPRQFRYAYLEAMNVQTVQGQKVAHLMFHFPGSEQQRSAVAHVYVLPARFVDLGEQPAMRFPTSTHNIEFLPQVGGGRSDHVYMVVYTGTTLEPFLLRGRSQDI